jgi:signal transduction histidine kinase
MRFRFDIILFLSDFYGPDPINRYPDLLFFITNFANFNPPLSILQWTVFIGFTGVTSVLSIFSIWKYTDVEKRLDSSDLSYEQKFLSVNNGVSVITHSLKNQLLMIDVLANKISREINQNNWEDKIKVNEVARNLQEISAITNQTLRRITQLYKAFKSISFNLKPYNIIEIVAKSLENVKHIPENIKIEKNINGHMTVLADSLYLIEAISNLIINAFEAIGGKQDGKVSIQAHLEGDWCVLEIEDNGIGIAPNELERIFDPFYTQKITTKNWGIGLSYAKQIIKSHFGYLQVKSQIQKGSTFSVVLPVINGNTNKIQKRDGWR